MKKTLHQVLEKKLAERRLKIVGIDHNRVLHLLTNRQPTNTYLSLLEADLPDDAMVISVHPNPVNGTFDFVVSSKEFEAADEGCALPRISLKYRVVKLKVEKERP